MKVAILPSNEKIGEVAADFVETLLSEKSNAILGLATGSSPLPLYKELIARHKAGRLSFANCRAFTLDEYVGLDPEHPERYANFIRREFTDQVDFPEGAVNTPNDKAENLNEGAAAYDASIREAGGVDFQILGIGSDGHIAFNEPGESLTSRTHVGFLTDQTREDNARFFDGDITKVPTRAMTQGLGTIMEARQIVLIAQGKGKARAVRELVEGGVSSRWPATILQMHQNVFVLIDEDAASELELKEHYREDWAKYVEFN
ncbi:MAG: glucosamine-6-phosphate deaminase [Actinomycetaceae bacterium]|nr:glucosamine-6-phosphate deaminase [Actinomycetaceae bacterium]